MRTGRPRRPFWQSVHKTEGCWEWVGSRNREGYGVLHRKDPGQPKRTVRMAHRVAYELLLGPIPKGLVLDHLCRNRACVRPDHLSVVTDRENILRGHGVAAVNASKTHDPAGHPYDAVHGKQRACRICRREAMRRHRARKRLQVTAEQGNASPLAVGRSAA